MAVTQNSYTQSGSTTEYAFTFPYLKTTDVKVQLDATVTTAFSLLNATTIKLDSAPPTGTAIKIYRETDTDTAPATFYAGSSVKSEDLNDNFTQNLYANQEINARYISNLAPVLTGNLTMAEDTSIVFEGATDDDFETTLTVADPAGSDKTITLPNQSGNVLVSGNASIVTADIANNAITSAKIVDGTIVAGDIATNTITGTQIASNAIDSAELAANAVTAAKVNANAIGTTKIIDDAVTTAKINADAVTGAEIADNAINSEHYTDGSIDTAHIANSQITNAKIAANAVTTSNIQDGQVTTAKIPDDAVTNAKVADDAINSAQLADYAVTTATLGTNSVSTVKIIDANVTTAKIADSAINVDKLANNSINADKIAGNAVTTAKILNDAVTGDKINASAVAAEQLATNAVTTAKILNANVTTDKLADSSVTTAKIAANAVTTTEIADSELSTLATMQAGTASLLAGGTALTSTLTELNLLDGKAFSTTVNGSSTDVQIPSAKAVNDQIVSLMQDAGGYFPIADDASFPNTNPDPNDDAGTIVSIADAGGLVVNGSGVSTTGRTLGGSTVTINGIDSSLNSTTIAAGKGMLVQTTSTLNTYTYHRLLLDEAGVASAQTLVTDFNARYRVGASNPTSSLDDGDLFFNTTSNKILVYNVSGSSWDEVTSSGDFKILTVVPNGATTGSPVFDGSIDQYDLRDGSNAASVTKAQQLIVSLNGVIQKPNAAYDASGEGFALDGSNGIRFCDPPATGSTLFVTQIGSAVTLSSPADNSVTTVSIQNAAVTTDKLGADAVTGAKIADDAVGAEHIEVLDAALQFGDSVKAQFGTGNDLAIYHTGSHAILDNDTGDTYIKAAGMISLNPANTEDGLLVKANGAVELMYDNTKKFETTSTGCNGPGGWQSPDGQAYRAGTDNDLLMYHSGSHALIDNNTGTLKLQSVAGCTVEATEFKVYDEAGSETVAEFISDGACSLYHNNVKKFETTSDGVTVTGDISVGAGEYYASDNGKIRLGSSQDLEIYHDGTDSYIKNWTGKLHLKALNTEDGIIINTNGAVELYYDNAKKLETVTGGVTVTGVCTATSFAGSGANLTGISAGNTPAFAATDTDGTSIDHATYTALTFDTEVLDSDSAFTASAFTVPSGEGGNYWISYSAAIDSIDDGKQAQGVIYKDTGSGYAEYVPSFVYNKSPANGAELTVAWSGIMALSAGDKIKVYVRHNNGSGNTEGIKVQGGFAMSTFQGFKVS